MPLFDRFITNNDIIASNLLGFFNYLYHNVGIFSFAIIVQPTATKKTTKNKIYAILGEIAKK